MKRRDYTLRHQRATETRAAILRAAADVFAQSGLTGARTEAIARDAGVNKALLYYYFKSKDELYCAVLEEHLREFSRRGLEVLDSPGSARSLVLRYVNMHFDFISSRPCYPALFQRMMMSGGHLRKRLVEEHLIPLSRKFTALIERGTRHREFRKVDARHTAISLVALTVFYFSGANVIREVSGVNPYSKPQLKRRKEEVLEFIRHGLFRDPKAWEQ